jgi:hypothetical protein
LAVSSSSETYTGTGVLAFCSGTGSTLMGPSLDGLLGPDEPAAFFASSKADLMSLVT